MYVNATSIRLFLGSSTPAIRAISLPFCLQPCLCLCRGLTQITRTTPRRRTILQSLQIRLTDARTFIETTRPAVLRAARIGHCQAQLSNSVNYPTSAYFKRCEHHRDLVSGHYLDV